MVGSSSLLNLTTSVACKHCPSLYPCPQARNRRWQDTVVLSSRVYWCCILHVTEYYHQFKNKDHTLERIERHCGTGVPLLLF